MKTFRLAAAASLVICGTLSASNGLYYMGDGVDEPLPLKWTVGVNLIWDDNVNPTIPNIPAGRPGFEEDTLSINPYVAATFASITPQTTTQLYARLGAIYYFDQPAASTDDVYPDAKLGLNVTHRFSERLRWVSRNYVAYQLEPDYNYGYANSRLSDPYVYWSTDQALGYRWTSRFATYTGIRLWGLDYDSGRVIGGVGNNQDRTSWMVYNDFRFQASVQTVLTLSYRYSQTDAGGVTSDSTNHFILGGIEHRVSPTTVLIFRGGAQIHEIDAVGGQDSTAPYAEFMIRSRVNEQFNVRSFARYGIENYDTTFGPGQVPTAPGGVEFDSATSLRIGVQGDYAVSPMVNVFGGISYIMRDYDDGRVLGGVAPLPAASESHDLINVYVGVSVKINEWLYAQASYNFTDSSSDILGYTYDRNRISVGMRAEF